MTDADNTAARKGNGFLAGGRRMIKSKRIGISLLPNSENNFFVGKKHPIFAFK
jgi:hypothetical protein